MELIRLTVSQRLLRLAITFFGLAFTLLPLLWVLSIAIRPGQQAVFPVSILPSRLTLENVWGVLFGPHAVGVEPYRNAALYGFSSAIVTGVASTLGGYALA